MAVLVEANFMNALPFSLRAAAHDLYVQENLDTLADMRFGEVYPVYRAGFTLTAEQWHAVLNAVILTRLCQLTLGFHLKKQNLVEMNQCIKVLLEMQDESDDMVLDYLQEKASLFAGWYTKLLKLIKR